MRNESLCKTIITDIREARQKAGMTQAQVAERLRVARPTVASYETGRIVPRADQYLLIMSLGSGGSAPQGVGENIKAQTK
ncbi:MAG TPA: helix-turn-helix transcriptional regulator [Thermodesulfobacteriota bacterium]|nr:helix-turn-helix transcriptional regulator [Thermodesulfobacteriota bacterium]